MKVLGQPSLCVSRMCGEVVSCSCWNCVYVNAFTRSPGQVSLPSRSGLACRRGLWKVIHFDFSRAREPLPSLADTLSEQLSGELLPHVNPSHRTLACYAPFCSTCGEKEVWRHNRSPPQRGCARFSPGLGPQAPTDQSVRSIHLACEINSGPRAKPWWTPLALDSRYDWLRLKRGQQERRASLCVIWLNYQPSLDFKDACMCLLMCGFC